jgi:Na+/melibiose symporter-like transporter
VTVETVSSPNGDRLSFSRLLAFSQPGLTVGALAVAISVYLPRYFAAHFGMGLAAVGGVFMLIRLIDVGFDPMVGVVMDQTRTRIGRYRAWLVLGAPVISVGTFMLFIPQGRVTTGYLMFWLLVYYIGYSLITLSHSAWGSVVAGKYHERSRVFGAIQTVSTIGATLILLIPSLMGAAAEKAGADVRGMGWAIVIVTPIAVALAALATPERQVSDSVHERFRLKDYLEVVLRPDMLRIVIADFCLTLGPGWMSALYLFYFHDARGFPARSASLLLLIYIGAGVLGALTMSRVAMKIGKHRTLQLSATGYSVGLLSLILVPKGAFLLAAIPMFALGFLASSFTMLDRAMVSDVGDVVRLEQGKQRVSLLFAMITSSQKIATALSIGLSFTVLGWVGFNPKEGAINTPGAVLGLELVYLITPVVFVMIGGACYIGYTLDHRRHAQVRQALEARDALGAASAQDPPRTAPHAPPALAAN